MGGPTIFDVVESDPLPGTGNDMTCKGEVQRRRRKNSKQPRQEEVS